MRARAQNIEDLATAWLEHYGYDLGAPTFVTHQTVFDVAIARPGFAGLWGQTIETGRDIAALQRAVNAKRAAFDRCAWMIDSCYPGGAVPEVPE